MAVFREQPYGGARFAVQIDGAPLSALVEVHLPELTSEVVEYREGGDAEGAGHHLPGRPGIGRLLLRRGFQGSLELYDWWHQATSGEAGGRRTVLVQLFDEGAGSTVAEWELRGAWPVRHFFSPLVAQGCQILLEQAEIACDGLLLR